MAAPRKTPAKKVTPRKAVAEKIDTFEALRRRAGDQGLNISEPEPYILGADRGFDPPLVISYPTKLSDKVALDVAARRADYVSFLHTLLGDTGFARVLAAFDNEPDGERLLIGLQLIVLDHFLGRGAGDVPGGSPAS